MELDFWRLFTTIPLTRGSRKFPFTKFNYLSIMIDTLIVANS